MELYGIVLDLLGPEPENNITWIALKWSIQGFTGEEQSCSRSTFDKLSKKDLFWTGAERIAQDRVSWLIDLIQRFKLF